MLDPSDAHELTRLVGEVIESITLRSFELHVAFEGGASLLIEHQLSVEMGETQLTLFPAISAAIDLKVVLGKPVVDVILKGNDLILVLGADTRIRVHSTPQFESYHYEKAGKTITI